MELSLNQLESALKVIGDVGKGEITFEYDGHMITLKVLLPDEEVEAQRYASAIFESEEDDRISGFSYLDRFKQVIICYSIAQIDALDLREVDFVTTEEELDNGKKVKLPRHLAVRQIIQKSFSRTATTHMFKKYYELLSQVEEKAEKAVKFEPSDRKTEIERLNARIKELDKEDQEEQEAMQSVVSEQVKSMVESGTLDKPVVLPPEVPPQQRPQSPQTASPAQQTPLPEPEGPRQSIIPNVVPQSPEPEPEVASEPLGVITPTPEDGFENIGSSLVDADDTENLQQQIAAENARLVRARQMQQTPRRPPPHVAAKKVVEELEKVEKAEVKAAGTVGGVPAFRIGNTQEISEKTREGSPDEKPRINPRDVGEGSKNPRFRGPQTP